MDERTLLRILTGKLKALTLEQADLLPGLLEDLVAKGLLLPPRQFYAHPLVPMTQPLFAWQHGDPEPEDSLFGHLSYFLGRRWSGALRETTLLAAGKKAYGLLGLRGKAAFAKRSDSTHEVHLAALFLSLPADKQELWRPLQSHGDARILGKTVTVIELGGSSYKPQKIRRQWARTREKGLRFELW